MTGQNLAAVALPSFVAGVLIGLVAALAAALLLWRARSAGGASARANSDPVEPPPLSPPTTGPHEPAHTAEFDATDEAMRQMLAGVEASTQSEGEHSPEAVVLDPEVTVSTRTLTGDEAVRFLHEHGLDEVVERALGQTAALRSSHVHAPQPGVTATPEVRPQAAPRPRVSIWWKVPAWLLGALALLFVALMVKNYHATPPPSLGTFTSTGTALGEWQMNVDTCHTGMARGFFGAQLFSSADPRLAILFVEDPLKGLGASINSTAPGDKAYTVGKGDCAVLRGASRNGSYSRNQLRSVTGSYELDCTVSDSHVAGQVRFENCL